MDVEHGDRGYNEEDLRASDDWLEDGEGLSMLKTDHRGSMTKNNVEIDEILWQNKEYFI